MICTRWTPAHDGGYYGFADLFLEEVGLLINGVRVAMAALPDHPDKAPVIAGEVMQLPRCITVIEGIATTHDMLTFPRSGDKFVFFAMACRAIDQYNERRAEELRAQQAKAPLAPGSSDIN